MKAMVGCTLVHEPSRRNSSDGPGNLQQHDSGVQAPFVFPAIYSSDGKRRSVEVDHPDALAVRDGMAMFAAPGNVPAIFDYEGVSQVIADLSGCGADT